MATLELSAPAKINLFLNVHPGTDSHGYHTLDSIFHAVDLADKVMVTTRCSAGDLQVIVQMPGFEHIAKQEDNIAYKAALQLGQVLNKANKTVVITIEKNIPSGAGLGGGSSDAAAVLKGLCCLWGVDVLSDQVLSVARELGADVPFFLQAQCAYMSDRGDRLVELFEPLQGWLVLVKPDVGVSTPQAYKKFDALRTQTISSSTFESLLDALRDDEDAPEARLVRASQFFENNLEEAAQTLCPQISQTLSEVQSHGVRAMMSGSGSACFALCTSQSQARSIEASLQDKGYWACVTRFAN